MTIHAILTVDLNGYVSSEAREIFYESLKSRFYIKHKLTTLWTVQFTPSSTKADAERVVREHVALAVQAAGIGDYEALVMFGDQPAIEWKKNDSFVGLRGLLDTLGRFN